MNSKTLLRHSAARAGLISAFAVAIAGVGQTAAAQELLWTTENWDNTSTERSNVYGGEFPKDTEVADDFDLNAEITRVVMSGKGCSQCSPPGVEGVYVRFYEWTESGPGGLQEEYLLAGDDPDFVYGANTPSLLDITLPFPFEATGRHYVAVQMYFDDDGGWWAKGRAGRNNPKVGPVYSRDNLAGGEWEVDIDHVGFETDASFELYGAADLSSPWEYVPSPPEDSAYLWDVRPVDGANDVWAVGHTKEYYNQFSYDRHSLAIHWDGSQWTQVPSPSPGVYDGGGTDVDMYDVDGVASDDAWAVGTYKIQHPGDGFIGFQTFAMHWDGSDWSHVPTPVTPVGMSGAGLYSVVTIDSDHAYAAGYIVDPVPGDQVDWIGYALHWDGSDWTALPHPPTPGRRNEIRDIAAVTENEIILIGGHSGDSYGAEDIPYVLRWDGSDWTLEDVPVPAGQNFLESVTVIAPDDIWIAGTNDQIDQGWQPLFLHFDGESWTIFDNVQFDHYGGTLRGVTALGPNDIWASGSLAYTQGSFNRPLLMHYDGTTWSQTPTDPDGPDGGTLFSVDAVENGEVWAVGISSNRTHTQHLPDDGDDISQPAELDSLEVTRGSIISGGLTDLVASDDETLHTRSERGLLASEPNLMEMIIGAVSPLQESEASTLDITIESNINHPTGTAKIGLRNFASGQFEQVGQFSLGVNETVETLTDIDASDHVRAGDARIEVSVKHIVLAVFTASGFDSFIDQVSITVE